MNNNICGVFSSFYDMNIAIAIYESNMVQKRNYDYIPIYANSRFSSDMQLELGEYYWEYNDEYLKLNLDEILERCISKVVSQNKPQKFFKYIPHSKKYYLIIASRFMDEYIQLTIVENSSKFIDNKKQRLCQEVIDNAKDIIFMLDENGKILNANKEAVKEYGYTYDEFKSLDVFDLRNSKNKDFIFKQFDEAKAGSIEFETIHYRKDGSYFPAEVKSFVIDIDNYKYVASIIRNIVNRRRIEEEMKNLSSIVESSDDAIIGKSTDGIIKSWNKGAEKLYGYTKNEIIGKHISVIYFDNDYERIKETLNRVNDGIKIQNHEIYMKKSNGEAVAVSITVSPIYDIDNNIIGASSIARDITEKQKLIERLNENEEKYRTLYSSMSQGVALHQIIVDDNNVPVDYRFLDMNDSFQKILNIKAEDYIGKTVLEVLPETEKYWIENYGRVALSGQPLNFENYSKEFNKYFNIYAYSPKLGQFAVLVTDVTERKLSEIENTVTDGLTGIYNRRYINERLPIDVNNSIIHGHPLSVIMTDIDHLKNINDKYGHVVGDRIIKDFANLIKNSIRKGSDWVGRYGGDEFLIVLNNTELENAYNVAEKIRKTISDTIFEYGDTNVRITSSFGLYSIEDEKLDVENILIKVDKNLYEAKRKGRNRTVKGEGIETK
ncbi:diguanylate cyclase [Clostridium sp. WILCCON 0269]|uniref:Diguanylate cyclase n=1 Tax=Candidatus Clostridium eludens TaxID=3381663 RepID=A0ABW8SHC4_9CLOT